MPFSSSQPGPEVCYYAGKVALPALEPPPIFLLATRSTTPPLPAPPTVHSATAPPACLGRATGTDTLPLTVTAASTLGWCASSLSLTLSGWT